MPPSTDIHRYIASCDSRFVGYTPGGEYRLLIDGHETVIHPDVYNVEHPLNPDEIVFALLHLAIGELQHDGFVPVGDVVDVLLDLRSAIKQSFEAHSSQRRLLYTAWMDAIDRQNQDG